jgi:hypothetical protein
MNTPIGRSVRVVLLCAAALICLTITSPRGARAQACFIMSPSDCAVCCDDSDSSFPFCLGECGLCYDDFNYGCEGVYFDPDDFACYPAE